VTTLARGALVFEKFKEKDSEMAEKKPKTGTPRIVIGSLVIVWGFFVTLNLIAQEQGLAVLGGVGLLALGIWGLVVGINQRTLWKKTL